MFYTVLMKLKKSRDIVSIYIENSFLIIHVKIMFIRVCVYNYFSVHYLSWKNIKLNLLIQLPKWKHINFKNTRSVSYTHLDVYKRQGFI